MSTRVTIQNIADELGISRNTVSKAINNTGILADSTRDKVLKKAAEMGYKQFSYVTVTDSSKPILTLSTPKQKDEIALFFANIIGNSHFATVMLDKFQKELSALGYTLTMHRVLSDEVDSLTLPASFSRERTAGSSYRFSRALRSRVIGSRYFEYGQSIQYLPVYQRNDPTREDKDRIYRRAYALPVFL